MGTTTTTSTRNITKKEVKAFIKQAGILSNMLEEFFITAKELLQRSINQRDFDALGIIARETWNTKKKATMGNLETLLKDYQPSEEYGID